MCRRIMWRKHADEKRKPEVVGPTPVYAAKDYRIGGGSVHNIEVSSDWTGRNDWIIEKLIVGSENGDLSAALTTWVHVDSPMIPMANPGTKPIYICVRDLVGHLVDPSLELDHPKDEEELNKMVASVEALQSFIGGSLGEQELGESSKDMP